QAGRVRQLGPVPDLALLTALLMRSLSSTTSLNASAISPSSPVRSMGSRTEKFPFRNAFRAARRWRPLRFDCSIAVPLPIDVSQPLSPNWSLADHARCAVRESNRGQHRGSMHRLGGCDTG